MSLKNDLPSLEMPISYEDLSGRLLLVREHIYADMERTEVAAGGLETHRKFEEDIAFREATAEVLLGCILWIEARRTASEILRDCTPEIRKGMVSAQKVLVDFLNIKRHSQPKAILNRGSLVDAWIRLFAEFRDMLTDNSQDWIWKREQIPFVPDKYRP